MDSPFAGKCYLVTGAARRVGAAIVRRLHAGGANVVIHHRGHGDEAAALAASCNAARPHSARTVALDLSEIESLPALVDTARSTFGRLDGLVNNASTFFPTPLGGIDEDDWSALIVANLKAPLFLSQAAAPALREHRGAIVNIVDIHAERPLKDYLVYSVAKAGLAGLTRSLALELAPDVRVNGVSPGPIAWPDAVMPEHGAIPEAERARVLASTPLRREGGVESIADAVAFLFGAADFVTGQILAVDGGRSVHL